MRLSRVRVGLLLVAPLLVAAGLGCRRGAQTSATPQPQTTPATVAAGNAGTIAATASATAAATQGAIPVAGGSFQVGNVTVVADRFRAQVSDPDGVNIRSSPEVKSDNRTGSIPNGGTVEVEGRVQGQEAVAGQGTTWYYLGTSGTTPQFAYAGTGTFSPLTGSATPAPAASATPAATAAVASPSPVTTPPAASATP